MLILLTGVYVLVMLTGVFVGVLKLIWSIMVLECIARNLVDNGFNN